MDYSFKNVISIINDKVETAISGIEQGKIFQAMREHVGNLPGYGNGPFDAARHLGRASVFYSEHPRLLKTDSLVDTFLNAREAIYSSTNSPMDYHNNEVGKQIGIYVRQHGGTREDAYRLSAEAIKKSLGDPINLNNWKADADGVLHSPQATVTLSNGLVVPSIVIMPKEKWINGSLPTPVKVVAQLPAPEESLGNLPVPPVIKIAKAPSLQLD